MDLPDGVTAVTTIAVALMLIAVLPASAAAQAGFAATEATEGEQPSAVADGITSSQAADIYTTGEPDNESEQQRTYQVNENGESSFSSTSKQVDDKRSYVADSDATDGVTTMGSSTISDSDSSDVEGSTIALDTEMTYSFSSGIYATFEADGTTEASWYGTDPYNADEIKMSTTVGVDGVEVTVTYPPSLSPGSGYSATITKTFTDEWTASHEYSGFKAKSAVALYNGYQKDSATFTFDNSAYTLFTNANTDLI